MTANSPSPGTDGARGVSLSPFARWGPPRWFAFQTVSNRERAIAKAAELAGIPAFLPSYWQVTQWSDRKKQIERLLFPGYVFLRLDPVVDLPYVLQLSGVIAVLPSNLGPIAITDAEIENLMQAVSSPANFTPSLPVAGDKVTIKRGPLKGVSGIVQREGKALRLVVAVEMLNRAVSVELEAADLAKE